MAGKIETPGNKRIMTLIEKGWSTAEIARHFSVSPNTVRRWRTEAEAAHEAAYQSQTDAYQTEVVSTRRGKV